MIFDSWTTPARARKTMPGNSGTNKPIIPIMASVDATKLLMDKSDLSTIQYEIR